MISRFTIAASLALALAACGSSKEPSDEATRAVAVPSEAATSAPQSAPTDAAATPSPTPSATTSDSAEHKEGDKDEANSKNKDADDSDDHPDAPPQAFQQCAACHSTAPGKTIIGPSLAGVYGTRAGQVPGFQFSDAMKSSGLVLNTSNLDKFLTDPKSVVPGTIMAFNGLKDASQRKAVIDYLKTLK